MDKLRKIMQVYNNNNNTHKHTFSYEITNYIL